jgi:co-chaperonin GroES (HSP10)
LKRPEYYATADDLGTEREIKVGDVVLFKDTAGSFFDLVKDSKLIRMYDIVAVER